MNKILSKLGATSLVMTGTLTLGAVAISATPISSVAAAADSCTYSGVWEDAAKGGLMNIKVYSDGTATGTYEDGRGRLKGRIYQPYGAYRQRFNGVYSYRHTRTSVARGDFKFEMLPGCEYFHGVWYSPGEKHSWDHERLGSQSTG